MENVGKNATFLSGWRYRAILTSMAVAVAIYLCFSLWGGISDVTIALRHVGAFGISVMLCLSLLNYFLRFVRWQIYLHALGHHLQWRTSFRIYLAGFALTTTPGKAGEAIRSVLLKQWTVPYTHSFAALLSERLSDLAAVVLLALLGMEEYRNAESIVLIGIICVSIGLFILSQQAPAKYLLQWGQKGKGKLRAACTHLSQTLMKARCCFTPKLIIKCSILSVMAWAAEAVGFYMMLHLMGANITIIFAIFVYSVAMLGGAISFLPGGIGGTEAVMAALLIWQGIGRAEAVAATVLIRLATLWFAVFLGVISLAMSKLQRSDSPTS